MIVILCVAMGMCWRTSSCAYLCGLTGDCMSMTVCGVCDLVLVRQSRKFRDRSRRSVPTKGQWSQVSLLSPALWLHTCLSHNPLLQLSQHQGLFTPTIDFNKSHRTHSRCCRFLCAHLVYLPGPDCVISFTDHQSVLTAEGLRCHHTPATSLGTQNQTRCESAPKVTEQEDSGKRSLDYDTENGAFTNRNRNSFGSKVILKTSWIHHDVDDK